MALYLYINLFTISFPLFRSFEKRVNYYGKWKSLFPAIVITALFFLVWDVIFTRSGIWGFNEDYLIGIEFASLPIEEWLFFLTVPFASVFIYECVLYFIKKEPFNGNTKPVYWILGSLLVLLALFNIDKAYTFWNFLFTGIFILISSIFMDFPNKDRFLIAYILHLIPFLIVNGILTGSWIEEPIVWYNNAENLSIRLFTIPIEDTIYAFLLLYMNIFFFEIFKKLMPGKRN